MCYTSWLLATEFLLVMFEHVVEKLTRIIRCDIAVTRVLLDRIEPADEGDEEEQYLCAQAQCSGPRHLVSGLRDSAAKRDVSLFKKNLVNFPYCNLLGM